MSTQDPFNPPRRSRWLAVAIVAAMLGAAAIGITTLRHNTAHAVHPGRPPPATLAGALPDAWQAPASDASLPSAHEVFKARAAPDFDASVPTF